MKTIENDRTINLTFFFFIIIINTINNALKKDMSLITSYTVSLLMVKEKEMNNNKMIF